MGQVLWPELEHGRIEEVDGAFRAQTGMSIGDYFSVGTAVMARLVNRGRGEDTFPGLDPAHYFSSVKLDPAIWQAFFRYIARDVAALRGEVLEEERRYGRTTYAALAFERFPLAEVEPGRFVPLSMHSLQRRVTEGVFHILSEAAESEGKDRRYYSSTFGQAFQVCVERTLRRGTASEPAAPPITADIEYGPTQHRRRSSDVIVGYERNPLFVEVVSGPLRAATLTRGDLESFTADVRRLVTQKAKQLDQCIGDFFAGELELPGVDPVLVNRAWPVIVTSHAFPHFNTVTAEVEDRVRQAGYLRDEGIGRLAIVSAEELIFCEGFMQRGRSFLSLVRGWKAGDKAALPFKNYLIELAGGEAPGSDHFERRFAEANAEHARRLLASDLSADEMLAHARGEQVERER